MMKKPLLSEMTLREKIAQTMCVYQYNLNQKVEVDECITRTPQERDEIMENGQYGCMWCCGRQKLKEPEMNEYNYGTYNPDSREYREWVQQIDRKLKWHILRATDAEAYGAGSLFSDASTVCGGLSVGATDSEELSFQLGAAIARELRAGGVNWRWAPVVDMPGRFAAGIMRPFNPDDVDRLVKLSVAHIRGMQSENVAGTAKHFPGPDKTEYRDSHFTPTVNSSTMEEWWELQGKAFQGVIDGGVYSVMIGHSAFPAADNTCIDGKYLPATLSKKIITDLLKGTMGFRGVVVTDAVGMAALKSFYPREELYVELLKAGNDVLLGVENDSVDIVEKAALEGRISEERINDACQRVLDMKEKLGMFEDDYIIGDAHFADYYSPATKEINKQIAEKSITLVRDVTHAIPYDSKKIKTVTIVVSTHNEAFMNEAELLRQAFERRGAEVNIKRRLEKQWELDEAVKSDLIIYAAYIAMHNPKGALSFFGQECSTFSFAFSKGKEKSIGISFGYPYIHYDFMGNANTFINAYGISPDIIEACVAGIYGEIPIVGKSPVKLNPDKRVW